MRSFILALTPALALFATHADAATLIAAGIYGAGENVFETGQVSLGPGRYRFYLDFTRAPLFQDSEVGKQTTTNFFCVDPELQAGEFACGGNDVPTLAPFTSLTSIRSLANVTVDPFSSTSFPSAPIVKYEEFDECCTYEVDFAAGEAGNWSLSVAAVPEPSTWAMMIVGFGAIGGAVRMRRAVYKPAV